MVRRSDGKTTVWLNNRAVTEKESAGATMVGKVRPDGTVTLQSAQTGRNVPLRVGQRAELLSGRVEEGYRRVGAKAGGQGRCRVEACAGARRGNRGRAAPEGRARAPGKRRRCVSRDAGRRAIAIDGDAAASPRARHGANLPAGHRLVPAPVPTPTPVQPTSSLPGRIPMSAQCPPRRAPRPARQRGQAMLLTVLLLGRGVLLPLYTLSQHPRRPRSRMTRRPLPRWCRLAMHWSAGRLHDRR